jgi:hypothetical protein
MLKKIAFGSTPLINNFYWNEALKRSGYYSKTVMFDNASFITANINWDVKLKVNIPKNKLLKLIAYVDLGIRAVILFAQCVIRYDIFVISFDGFLIGKIPLLWRCQSYIFKALKKKVIVIPYGGDSYIYKNVISTEIQKGLIDSYPMSVKQQKRITQRVDYWKKHADVILPGFMHADIFGEINIPSLEKILLRIPNTLTIDLNSWRSERKPVEAGQVIEIAHMPNHRGFKGTERIIEVVEELRNEGFNIKFHLIEKISNNSVQLLLRDRIHILIDQIYAIGYGLNAIEGMASSCVVMANISNPKYTKMYAGTFLDKCPIVSVNQFKLKQELINIILNPERLNEISDLSREYAEKYHSYKYFSTAIGEVIELLYKN